MKLVIRDVRLGTDARFANTLEGYVRKQLESMNVKVSSSATQVFELSALPPEGRCAVAAGRVFTDGGEAFALGAHQQHCAPSPGDQMLVADYVIGSVVNALDTKDAPARSDFQHAVDAVVSQLVLKVR